jgi:hypothetical protein
MGKAPWAIREAMRALLDQMGSIRKGLESIAFTVGKKPGMGWGPMR